MAKRFRERFGRQCVGVLAVSFMTTTVGAQEAGGLLAVSKPPAQVVPSDPAQGLIFRLDADMSSSDVRFDTAGGPVSLEYVQFDSAGNAYASFDDGSAESAPGGVLVLSDFLNRENGNFDPARDRLISGSSADLDQPKDLLVLEDEGVLVIADFGAAKLAVFDSAASGDVAPLFEVTDLGSAASGEPRRPWGLAFDARNARLYVGATDGDLLVYNDFLSAQGATGPDAVITPSLDGEKISANLHDLVYDAETNILIASDVGGATTADQANFDTDGAVFIILEPGSADGPTDVQVYLRGPATMLGNPVGLAFDGATLYVSERTADIILRFDNVLDLDQGPDLFPSAAVTVPKPEGIVLAPNSASR